MALDKQRILSELGSVVNQLQSADCGCMSKLFNNGGESSHAGMNPGGCRHGCCSGCSGHHSCTPCAGEPHSRMPCGGCCNPPKLYSETYNYLANNVMNPALKEVYDDLKSMNVNNTIMNPLPPPNDSGQPNNMALVPVGPRNPDHPGQLLGQMMTTMSNNTENAMQNMDEGGMMGSGMGPQIAQMMNSGGRGKPQSNNNEGNNNQQLEAMTANTSNFQNEEAGVNPYPKNSEPFFGNSNMDNNMIQNPLVQYPMQMGGTPIINANDPGGNLMNNTNIGGGPIHSTMSSNPSSMQHNNLPLHNAFNNNMTPRHHNHGMHSAGMNKFNDIFPSMMQEDLGFDPMAIAVQMNPANKQKAAMETMQSFLMESRDPRKVAGQLSIPNTHVNQINSIQQPISQASHMLTQGQILPGPQYIAPTSPEIQNLQAPSNQIPIQSQYQPNHQQQYYAMNNMPQFPNRASGMLQQPQRMQQQSTNQIPMQNGFQTNQHQSVYSMQQQQMQQRPTSLIPMQNEYQTNQPQQAYSMNAVQPHQLQPQQSNLMPLRNDFQPNQQPQQLNSINSAQQQQLLQQQQLQQQQMQQQHLQQQQMQQQQLQQQQMQQQQQLQQQQLQQQLQGQQLLQQQPLQQQTLQQQPLQQQPLQQQPLQQPPLQQQPIRQQPLQQQPLQQQIESNPQEYSKLAPVEPAQQTQGKANPYMDPLLPSGNGRNVYYKPQTGYNTLGQPVQYVSPQVYRKREVKLPQTLSPHESLRNANKKYSNVKLTESRTSIAGTSPYHKTASRNSLQYIYNQYKGSNSYTQQNVPNNVVRGGTVSDGKLKVVQEILPQQPHVERLGGDTILNNQLAAEEALLEKINIEQIGDIKVEPTKPMQEKPSNPNLYPHQIRNGIQDMVYATANAQAPSWSFHGEYQKRYYSRPRARPRKYRYY